jgi:hypothetical protein
MNVLFTMSPTWTPSVKTDSFENTIMLVVYIIDVHLTTIVAVLGIFGNIISYLLQDLPKYRSSSTCFYMKALSVSDTLHLGGVALQRVVFAIAIGNIEQTVYLKWICINYWFWVHYPITVSSILLCVMSFDRLLALVFPLKSHSWCTIGRARKFTCAVYVISGAVHLPIQFFRVELKTNRGWMCPFHLPEYIGSVYNEFHSIVSTYAPIIIISLNNCGIIAIFKTSEQRRRQLLATTETKERSKEGHITRMLVIVCVTFVVGLLPSRIRLAYWQSVGGEYGRRVALLRRLSTSITGLFIHSNFALNCYLYIIPVKKFRDDLKQMFCPRYTHEIDGKSRTA